MPLFLPHGLNQVCQVLYITNILPQRKMNRTHHITQNDHQQEMWKGRTNNNANLFFNFQGWLQFVS